MGQAGRRGSWTRALRRRGEEVYGGVVGDGGDVRRSGRACIGVFMFVLLGVVCCLSSCSGVSRCVVVLSCFSVFLRMLLVRFLHVLSNSCRCCCRFQGVAAQSTEQNRCRPLLSVQEK